MTISNYPEGFVNGVTIKGVPIQQLFPGKVSWVNNSSVPFAGAVGGSDVGPGTYKQPYSTINGAIGKTVASRGDIIMVGPGHTETVSASATISFSKAGVAVIGMGSGTLRPTITFDTIIDSTINVDAANCAMKNMILTANFADITTAMNVGAVDFTAEDIYFKATATNMNFLTIATTDTTANEADGLTLLNCVWIEPDTATTTMVRVVKDIDRLHVIGNYINIGVNTGDLAALVVCTGSVDATNILVKGNYVQRRNDDLTQGIIMHAGTGTANTGMVEDNRVLCADDGPLLITADMRIGMFNNTVVSTGITDKSGYVLPAIDA